MRVRQYSRVQLLAILTAVLMAAVASAETKANKAYKTAIKNFGCINENYFRGAQPEGKDYAALSSMGVKTVIDLERDGDANEQKMVESNSMKFVRFPMTTTDRPDSKVVSEFLRIVNDPANQPVFVHCHGGRHRTGVMTAIYRLTHDSWTADQAFAEMKEYDFGRGFGHGALKDYVYDYFAAGNREIVGTGKESVKATAGGGSKN